MRAGSGYTTIDLSKTVMIYIYIYLWGSWSLRKRVASLNLTIGHCEGSANTRNSWKPRESASGHIIQLRYSDKLCGSKIFTTRNQNVAGKTTLVRASHIFQQASVIIVSSILVYNSRNVRWCAVIYWSSQNPSLEIWQDHDMITQLPYKSWWSTFICYNHWSTGYVDICCWLKYHPFQWMCSL